MTLTALKISHLEPYSLDIGSQIFAWLSTLFSRLKIERLIKQIGITSPIIRIKIRPRYQQSRLYS